MEVESIVSDLLTQRLIVKVERKGFIFGYSERFTKSSKYSWKDRQSIVIIDP
jgi:hypothetical protein